MRQRSIKRVLLVEDNQGDARVLREMLNPQTAPGVELIHVTCMREAENELAQRTFEIILLDLGLPDTEGLTAVRRAHTAAPRVPLVVLTGLDDESLAIHALQAGAQDYLIKGQVDTRALLRALRYAMERKSWQDALFVEKERLRQQGAALEATADGVMITDREGTITWVNAAFSRITKFGAEGAVGCKPSILRSGHHPDAVYAELWRTILSGQVWKGELTNRRRDGELYLDAHTITPVRDARGEISHFVSVMRDVSQQRRLEAELRQSQKMEAVGRLSGGVAHDFNNLLAVILGFGHMLLQHLPPGEKLKHYCDEMVKAANRGAGLTRQLLAFSRQQVLQPKVVDLNEVVAESERMLGRLLGEDVEIVTSLAAGLGQVQIDPGQLEQVIMNLAVNARDAMPQGGTLSIETANLEPSDAGAAQYGCPEEPGSYVRLTVSDNGTGMDEETRAHLFEPFFTTKDLGKGTGLGLATVYGVVEQSRGHISVESVLGQGTRFTILLPRLASRVLAVAAEVPDDAAVLEGTETVLLAEDDEAARGLWREMLQALGYRVIEAGNGAGAIAAGLAYPGRIDLLLTDVVMPRMGGRDLSERMTEAHPGLRVIFMSGCTADTLLRQGITGTAPFLQKPFTALQFARKIRETLDAEHPQVGSVA